MSLLTTCRLENIDSGKFFICLNLIYMYKLKILKMSHDVDPSGSFLLLCSESASTWTYQIGNNPI